LELKRKIVKFVVEFNPGHKCSCYTIAIKTTKWEREHGNRGVDLSELALPAFPQEKQDLNAKLITATEGIAKHLCLK